MHTRINRLNRRVKCMRCDNDNKRLVLRFLLVSRKIKSLFYESSTAHSSFYWAINFIIRFSSIACSGLHSHTHNSYIRAYTYQHCHAFRIIRIWVKKLLQAAHIIQIATNSVSFFIRLRGDDIQIGCETTNNIICTYKHVSSAYCCYFFFFLLFSTSTIQI